MNDVVMVTGGAGFVGSHVVERLIQSGSEVHVFDICPKDKAVNLAKVIENDALHYVEGDMRDAQALEAYYRPEASVIYHLASTVGVHLYMKNPLQLVDVIYGGTRSLLDLSIKHKTRLLFSSTSEVYGKNPEVPWCEESDRVLGSPSVDRWSYSTSKALCEHIVGAACRQGLVEASIVRFFNAYGPRQNPWYVISQSIAKILRSEPPLLYDGGNQTRCFTYIGDIAEGVLAAGQSDKALGEVFNLGNPAETTISEIISMILSLTGSDLRPQHFKTEKEYGKVYEDVPRRIPAIEKAHQYLEWSPTTSLETGLMKTIEWARNNPEWYAETA